jgi:hypothetical protein
LDGSIEIDEFKYRGIMLNASDNATWMKHNFEEKASSAD